jgi:hypothetical protein
LRLSVSNTDGEVLSRLYVLQFRKIDQDLDRRDAPPEKVLAETARTVWLEWQVNRGRDNDAENEENDAAHMVGNNL